MKLFKMTIISCMLLLFVSFTYLMKPPKFIKGSGKEIEMLKSETSLEIRFDYSDYLISKIPEKEWVAKQKQKGIEDPQQATEEFHKFWYGEIVPYQEEKFIDFYNKNCQNLSKLAKGTKSKFTLTLKAVTLFPYNNFGTISAFASNAIISETESGKVLAIIDIPPISYSVPPLKERVALGIGTAGKSLALFLLENVTK